MTARCNSAVLLGMLVVLTPLASAEGWTTADTWRESTYMGFHAADWVQTGKIARDPDRWNEENKILGESPSMGRVNAYFAATAIAHYAIAAALPAPWRARFQYLTIGIEATSVANNHSIGLRVKF